MRRVDPQQYGVRSPFAMREGVGCRGPFTALLLAASTLAGASDATDLIGTWTWTIPKTGCAMTRTFRSDGSTTVANGKKVTSGTFTVKSNREKTGRMLVYTVAFDDGGRDCDGTASTTVGERYLTYVHTDGAGLHMCLDASRSVCLGPYVKR